MSKHKLLVEGKNDQIAISTLCEHHDIWVLNKERPKQPPVGKEFSFECKSKGNDEKLLRLSQLRNELIESDLEAMGIVVDADTNAQGRWQALRNRLTELGYPDLPENPDANGTIIPATDELPRVGVWIMPDNQLEGMLETFIAVLIAPDDELWAYAEKCVTDIDVEKRPFKSNHLDKAKIHTWLAWQDEPGMPLGVAITNRCFKVNAPDSKDREFIGWLKRLFDC